MHINAGIAGLVCAIMLGKRVGIGKEAMAPHKLTVTGIGTGMLLLGWFGFNAGSNLEANGLTALVIVNTILGAAAATLAWSLRGMADPWSRLLPRRSLRLVAGLVAITPLAAGWVDVGIVNRRPVAGFICLFAVVWLKKKLGYDDALARVSACSRWRHHRRRLTGIFVNPNWNGWLGWHGRDRLPRHRHLNPRWLNMPLETQMTAQIYSVVVAVALSAVVSVIALFICKFTVACVSKSRQSAKDLDCRATAERAYSS